MVDIIIEWVSLFFLGCIYLSVALASLYSIFLYWIRNKAEVQAHSWTPVTIGDSPIPSKIAIYRENYADDIESISLIQILLLLNAACIFLSAYSAYISEKISPNLIVTNDFIAKLGVIYFFNSRVVFIVLFLGLLLTYLRLAKKRDSIMQSLVFKKDDALDISQEINKIQKEIEALKITVDSHELQCKERLGRLQLTKGS